MGHALNVTGAAKRSYKVHIWNDLGWILRVKRYRLGPLTHVHVMLTLLRCDVSCPPRCSSSAPSTRGGETLRVLILFFWQSFPWLSEGTCCTTDGCVSLCLSSTLFVPSKVSPLSNQAVLFCCIFPGAVWENGAISEPLTPGNAANSPTLSSHC